MKLHSLPKTITATVTRMEKMDFQSIGLIQVLGNGLE